MASLAKTGLTPNRAENDCVLITKFRVWLQDSRCRPDFSTVEIVGNLNYDPRGCVDVAVVGNGHDLRTLIAKQQDIFAAYLQSKPEERQD